MKVRAGCANCGAIELVSVASLIYNVKGVPHVPSEDIITKFLANVKGGQDYDVIWFTKNKVCDKCGHLHCCFTWSREKQIIHESNGRLTLANFYFKS
jgi:hypothetical protein